ncbi:MAG: hypothetical protein BWK76_12865 [Desulfobulbaceae bacterium A2]|nr:MAG: hypothetical protein BWK76_12865 [Desulfobulbaceae bacterium A2]
MEPSTLSLYPVWAVDFFGSLLVMLLAGLCLRLAVVHYLKDRENALANYLLWFFGALFAFGCSRSLGHMVQHLLYFAGLSSWWKYLSPSAGSLNTMTFFVMATVTFFFQRMDIIIQRMDEYRQKIQKNNRELLRLNQDIEQVVAERTKAEMALHVAHELRNPAVIIGGLVQRSLKSEQLTESDRQRLQAVLEQAERLEGLVGEFERLRTSPKEGFAALEMNDLVEQCLAIVEHEAEAKKVVLIWDRHAGLLHFLGNEHLMRVALLHVLRNAIDACGAGNSVTMSSSLGPEGLLLKIQDDGPGIAPELMAHIFDGFSETSGGLTGFGLPYVRQILQEHLGDIRISSRVGVGTEVTMILPTHLGEGRRVRGEESITASAPRRRQ